MASKLLGREPKEAEGPSTDIQKRFSFPVELYSWLSASNTIYILLDLSIIGQEGGIEAARSLWVHKETEYMFNKIDISSTSLVKPHILPFVFYYNVLVKSKLLQVSCLNLSSSW